MFSLRPWKRYVSITVLAIMLAISFQNASLAQTHISGSVSGTWQIKNSPYIVDDFATVEENSELIIEPGVEVRFSPNKYIMIRRGGKLTAIGKSIQKIIFTSDNNNPQIGDWRGIKLIDTSYGVKLQNCTIEYAQTGIYCEASVYGCDGAKNYSKIDSCLIRYCTVGISCEGEGHSIAGCSIPKTGVCSPTISCNTIYNNSGDRALLLYTGRHLFSLPVDF